MNAVATAVALDLLGIVARSSLRHNPFLRAALERVGNELLPAIYVDGHLMLAPPPAWTAPAAPAAAVAAAAGAAAAAADLETYSHEGLEADAEAEADVGARGTRMGAAAAGTDADANASADDAEEHKKETNRALLSSSSSSSSASTLGPSSSSRSLPHRRQQQQPLAERLWRVPSLPVLLRGTLWADAIPTLVARNAHAEQRMNATVVRSCACALCACVRACIRG